MKTTKEENNQLCPKCKSADMIHHGNWTGVMVSDIYAEHFWLCKCNFCGFTFRSSKNYDKINPIDDKRNHA